MTSAVDHVLKIKNTKSFLHGGVTKHLTKLYHGQYCSKVQTTQTSFVSGRSLPGGRNGAVCPVHVHIIGGDRLYCSKVTADSDLFCFRSLPARWPKWNSKNDASYLVTPEKISAEISTRILFLSAYWRLHAEVLPAYLQKPDGLIIFDGNVCIERRSQEGQRHLMSLRNELKQSTLSQGF